MFPWLASLSLEVNQIDQWNSLSLEAPGQVDYCWNDPGKGCLSLTSNQYSYGNGTRTYFRIYGPDNYAMPWHQLKHNNKVNGYWENGTEHWKVEFDVHKINNLGVLEPYYYISNNGDTEFKFDLLVYTPINFGSKTSLSLIENGDVVDVNGGDKHIYFHIKKTPWSMHNPAYDYFGDADKIYLGPTLTDDNLLHKFMENTKNYTPNSGEQAAFAFMWYKHPVKPLDRNRFGFKMHPTPPFERLPLIKDVTPVHETYHDPYNVTFNLTSYNNKRVRACWSRKSWGQRTWCTETFKPHDNIITGSINCSIPFDGSNVSTFVAIAQEVEENGKAGLLGWEMWNTITRYKYGSLRPILNLTTEPNDAYQPTDTFIYIEGIVDNENYVQFYYQFDANNATKGPIKSTSEEFKTLIFQETIPIPYTLPLGTNHTLRIWVTDDQGLSSEVYNKTFKYGDAGKPFVRNVYISDERLIQNSGEIELVVYGEGVYTADKQTAKVYIQVDNDAEQELADFTSSQYPVPFAGFYKFTPHEPAHHTFKVYTKESSDTYAFTTLIVWDPNAAQPPINIGKFVDKSNDINSEAKTLFNLHYIDFNEMEWNMTLNDEGFHCKYRTYNDSYTSKYLHESDLVHTSNGVTTQDDFEIKFNLITDPNTNFTLAQFNVTNKQYFERKFGLSFLGHSELAEDENTVIIYDQAHGKIVVNNSNSKHSYLSYTVFTSTFDNYPAPNKVLIDSISRNPDGGFNGNYFWDEKTAKKASGYGMSWTDTVIPGKGYIIYTITFAAFGNVKSPTRLVDNTKWKDTYTSTDEAYLNISFVDADGNENIALKIKENGGPEKSYPWSANDKFGGKMNFTQNSQVYTVSIQAFDNDTYTRFPSNKIEKTVYLKDKPKLSLTLPTKRFYSTKDYIVISGNVTGSSPLTKIYYRHFLHHPDDTWAPSAEMPARKDVTANQDFTFSINMDNIWPLDDDKWMIQFYAKDGELKSNDINFTFNLNPYNPPTLKKAGLSKKVAHQGEYMLGYAVVNDNEIGKLDIYISIDNKDKNSFPEKCAYSIARNPSAGKDTPIAFYWNIPIETTAGTHYVYFLVKNSEGIASEVYGPKVLTVTA